MKKILCVTLIMVVLVVSAASALAAQFTFVNVAKSGTKDTGTVQKGTKDGVAADVWANGLIGTFAVKVLTSGGATASKSAATISSGSQHVTIAYKTDPTSPSGRSMGVKGYYYKLRGTCTAVTAANNGYLNAVWAP